ncbi:uncharacterized protein LOC142980701 [Anticarsia gemmatalis]|uniref:uncharacterized protein LOC142980701 n=1 Tax=Anticarsia gemmatalis TaxID=129554 RepID=UPI003F765CBB
MYNPLCFSLLLFVLGSQATNHQIRNYWVGHYGHQVNYGNHHGHQRYDHHDHIEQPCSTHDINCIRNYFANLLECSPVHKPTPEPHVIKKIPINVPHSNMSATMNDVHVKGLNSGRIEHFYINKKTDTLVFEVEFGSLFGKTWAVMEYHRKGKEPIIGSDYAMFVLRHLSLTLTIQHLHSNHGKKHVYAYLSDRRPPLKVGPGLRVLEEIEESHMQWMRDVGLSAREALTTQGPAYFDTYFKTNICRSKH